MAAGIVDSKDILDFERYLDKKEKEIKCMDHVLGPELITFPQYISSSRSIMFTSHLKQFVTLNNPEFPRLFTNYENIFGKLSSALHKTKEELMVYKVVPKFSWAPKHIYTMFFHDVANKKYFCVTKKIAEELTEKFGYAFNNERMDKFNPGNKIKKGTTLFKSTSYDQYDNYCYGCNALTTYLIDNRTIEDAVICSQSFANKMISKEVETVKITINDNDLLLNLYGDSLQHKGFPDIGEKIKGKLICSKRRLINSQLLYDMKASNLSESNNLNDREYYSKGTVIDQSYNKGYRLDPDDDDRNITLTVSSGKTYQVRDVFDRNINSAKTILENNGFKVRLVDLSNSTDQTLLSNYPFRSVNTVAGQSPEADTTVNEQGTTVTLYYYSSQPESANEED